MGSGGSGHANRPSGWGKELGSHRGVTAYSNGSGGSTYYEHGKYGLTYQCVEYVNRFASQALGLPNMIGTGNAEDYAGSGRKGLTWVPNKPGTHLPEDGDIIVIGGGTYGHVAIATGGGTSGINIIQQNTSSAKGSLGVHKSKGLYSVKPWAGRPVLGWQHHGSLTDVNTKSTDTSTDQDTHKDTDNKPASETTTTTVRHKVKRGESLWVIAQQYYGDGNRYMEIARANKLTNPSLLRVGQMLTIPGIKSHSTKKKATTVEKAPETTPTLETTAPTESTENIAQDLELEATLGTVGSLSELSDKVGQFFRKHSAAKGTKATGKLTATLNLINLAKLKVDMTFSGSYTSSGWSLQTAWDVRISQLLFWSTGKNAPGLRFNGRLNINQKNGDETFKFLSASLIPKLQATQPALARALV